MATTNKWTTPAAIVIALSTEMNSQANGAFSSAGSTNIDNEAGLNLYIELELHLASLTPTGSPYYAVYMQRQIDGTNMETAPNISLSHQLIAVFPMSTAVAAKHLIIPNILIPPCVFSLWGYNSVGPSLAASGNTLKYRLYGEQAA